MNRSFFYINSANATDQLQTMHIDDSDCFSDQTDDDAYLENVVLVAAISVGPN